MSEQEEVKQAEEAVEQEVQTEEAPAETAESEETPDVSQLQFENFGLEPKKSGSSGNRIDMIMDIVLPVSIELGRTKMFVKDVLELERGSIIELDKMAGEPVDLYINNKKMAEGEVVVVDKHFGIRITNLIDPKDRIKNLGKDV